MSRSLRRNLRSPDLLRRFGAEWAAYAKSALVGFPTDEAGLLAGGPGHQVRLMTTVGTSGATLGVFDLWAPVVEAMDRRRRV